MLGGGYHGNDSTTLAAAFNLDGLYADGFNLYQYLSSNPLLRHDPMGLADDPFAIVDEYILETAANKAAFLTSVGKGAIAAAYVGAVVLSMLPFPVTAIAADIGADVLEGNVPPELVMMRRVLGVVALGAITVKIAKLGLKAMKYAARYISEHGIIGSIVNLYKLQFNLIGRAVSFLARKANSVFGNGCGCFTAATMVWTPAGAVPIVDVDQGAEVYAAPEDGGPLDFTGAVVASKITVDEASLLLLTVRHANGSVETIRTTDEHPFHIADAGKWMRADALTVGDRLSAILGDAKLESIAFMAERVPVYNLSIPGSPTYFVGQGGLWVHNCKTWVAIKQALAALRSGRSPRVHVVGSEDELRSLFRDWSNGGEELTSTYPGRLIEIPDGATVGLRESSSARSGRAAAIDFTTPDGTLYKVHIDPSVP